MNEAKSGAKLIFMWLAGLAVLGLLIYGFWPGGFLLR